MHAHHAAAWTNPQPLAIISTALAQVPHPMQRHCSALWHSTQPQSLRQNMIQHNLPHCHQLSSCIALQVSSSGPSCNASGGGGHSCTTRCQVHHRHHHRLALALQQRGGRGDKRAAAQGSSSSSSKPVSRMTSCCTHHPHDIQQPNLLFSQIKHQCTDQVMRPPCSTQVARFVC
jgi:hypothetical protein